MYSYGLSTLEIKHIIEQAILPDHCDFIEQTGWLTLRVTKKDRPDVVATASIQLEALNSSRAIAELIGKIRYLQSNPAVPNQPKNGFSNAQVLKALKVKP
jgi:hypothetical protein